MRGGIPMLNFNIQNQTITRTDNFAVVGDSKNYLKASFSFSEEWTGTITAVFDYGGKAYCVILSEDNTCTVPWEVIKPPHFTVSVFCGDLITANKVSVAVEKSGYCEGKTPAEPTPDVYRQILDSVKAPYIGENGNWFVYDEIVAEFIDAGVCARGEKGDPGTRGEKGDTGERGENGVAGADGYTPVKGTDYWTEEDKAEIKAYVGDALGDIETALDNIITKYGLGGETE